VVVVVEEAEEDEGEDAEDEGEDAEDEGEVEDVMEAVVAEDMARLMVEATATTNLE